MHGIKVESDENSSLTEETNDTSKPNTYRLVDKHQDTVSDKIMDTDTSKVDDVQVVYEIMFKKLESFYSDRLEAFEDSFIDSFTGSQNFRNCMSNARSNGVYQAQITEDTNDHEPSEIIQIQEDEPNQMNHKRKTMENIRHVFHYLFVPFGIFQSIFSTILSIIWCMFKIPTVLVLIGTWGLIIFCVCVVMFTISAVNQGRDMFIALALEYVGQNPQ
jgi:hypothetical protein